nr:MarR family transcriptional regulator [Bacillus sp. 165]
MDLSAGFRQLFRMFQTEVNELFTKYMPYNEFVVLRVLKAKSPQMASQIAYEVDVTSSHITAVTDRLVKKGYMTRKRSDSDRRIVYLEITEQGREVAGKLEELRLQYYKEKFAHLSEEEMKIMITLCQSIQ